MSKNRNKKTPMFVSNIPTNYDFIDYTEPGEAGPSAFGNPNLTIPGLRSQTATNQATSPPKKTQTTNWFDQMLKAQETNNIPTITVNSISTNKTQRIESSSSNYDFVKPNAGVGSTTYQSTGLYDENFSNNSKKPTNTPGKKQNQYTIQISQANYTNPYPYSDRTRKITPVSTDYTYNTPSLQQRKYQTKFTSQQSYQTSYKSPSTNFSTGYAFKDEPKFEKPKTNYQPTTSSSSSNTGFTDESLVNSLPEPARSNILAMIKRSKGLSS